jgi:hypothetical protein
LYKRCKKNRFTPEEMITTEAIKTKYISAFGECKTIPEWCKDPRCKVSRDTLHNRISKNYNAELSIITPPSAKRDWIKLHV